MRECWLCHRHEAVPVLATGRSPVGDPSETNFREGCLATPFFHQTLIKLPPGYRRIGTIQVGKPQSGDDGEWQQETLMLLQTLRTRDPEELAEGFRGWEFRFRQLGGGSFRKKTST
jgi:hypothetical protein